MAGILTLYAAGASALDDGPAGKAWDEKYSDELFVIAEQDVQVTLDKDWTARKKIL